MSNLKINVKCSLLEQTEVKKRKKENVRWCGEEIELEEYKVYL